MSTSSAPSKPRSRIWEAREKTLRAELLKRCVFEAEGAQYAAAVTQAMRWTLDTKSVRAEMGDAWFDRRCKQALVTTVTVAARAVPAKLAA